MKDGPVVGKPFMRLRLECNHKMTIGKFLTMPVDVQEGLGRNDRVFHVQGPDAELEVSSWILLSNSPHLHRAATTGETIDVRVLKRNAEGQPFMDGPELATEIARATVTL